MSQIAEQAGVSLATVSRVLNNYPVVAPETRAKVLQHSRQLGYVEAQRRPTPRRVGLMVPHFDSTYYAKLANSVALAVQERGGQLQLCVAAHGGVGDRERVSAQVTAAMRRFLSSGVEGALLVQLATSGDELAHLQKHGCPFVVIGEPAASPGGIPTVGIADYGGARAAVDHLLGLGHTRIGMIIGPKELRSVVDRSAGYHAALAAASLRISADLVREGDFATDGGYCAAQHLLGLSRPPTAIFSQNDRMAFGVLRAARERGLDVPGDVSVVGFDDEEVPSCMTPLLTTVQQPVAELGSVGVDLLYQLLDGRLTDIRRLELATSLIIRNSAGPPRSRGA